MRLIDADLLKENCKCTGKFEDNSKCVDLIELAKVIDAQPTACDVEKVVVKLEEQAEENRKYWCNYDDECSFGAMNAYQHSIRIVKGLDS